MSRKCGDSLSRRSSRPPFDDEARLAEGVYVAVDGAARHLEPFGQLVDVVGGVRREQLHQPQQALKFGLVHVLRIQ